MSNLMEI